MNNNFKWKIPSLSTKLPAQTSAQARKKISKYNDTIAFSINSDITITTEHLIHPKRKGGLNNRCRCWRCFNLSQNTVAPCRG